ncbi:helix-turn-helix domain-containing protein [Actinoalloteichus caeruleus]|uniref:AraC-type DNA-binding protein n=1 Tax=Actinoalloteichus caeruleus DSM 43889 TaxID=1120930 RepID=A0ABT1JES6_ACTCY|nr:AraC family transcriptional regulator [Actinoalloteichus caeruleus]MCP2330784.1 AraC-type DNA-binding protein [Actinoalloteichus caeruleus DSM 43889]
MTSGVEKAVERVIEMMYDHLGEQLTIDDLARTALFSKFHFTRVFQRITGVSPGRFLSAIRLARAKELLVSTSLTVAEISHLVGYSSIGTFSSRFRYSVGVSPTTYRQCDGSVSEPFGRAVPEQPTGPASRVRGTVESAVWDCSRVIFLGLFAGRLPEGEPAECVVLDGPGPYTMDRVPAGIWYVLAHALPAGRPHRGWGDRAAGPPAERTLLGTTGPVTVEAEGVCAADVTLRPRSIFDPPILLASASDRCRARDRLVDLRGGQRDGGQPDGPGGSVPLPRVADARPSGAVREPAGGGL